MATNECNLYSKVNMTLGHCVNHQKYIDMIDFNIIEVVSIESYDFLNMSYAHLRPSKKSRTLLT